MTIADIRRALTAPPTADDLRAEFAALADTPRPGALDTFAARLSVTYMGGGVDPDYRPLLHATRREWITWFRAVGFTYCGIRAEHLRPTGSVTLYRGASPGWEHGTSWTPRRDLAERWARRQPDSHVYAATVPRDRVLALILHDNALLPEFVAHVPRRIIHRADEQSPDQTLEPNRR